MSDAEETFDDIHRALRSVIETCRKQFTMIATTQIALLAVVEQLAVASLLDASTAADRMREMITEIQTTDESGLGKEVSMLADRIAKFAPKETPTVPQPPKGSRPKLVQ